MPDEALRSRLRKLATESKQREAYHCAWRECAEELETALDDDMPDEALRSRLRELATEWKQRETRHFAWRQCAEKLETALAENRWTTLFESSFRLVPGGPVSIRTLQPGTICITRSDIEDIESNDLGDGIRYVIEAQSRDAVHVKAFNPRSDLPAPASSHVIRKDIQVYVLELAKRTDP